MDLVGRMFSALWKEDGDSSRCYSWMVTWKRKGVSLPLFFPSSTISIISYSRYSEVQFFIFIPQITTCYYYAISFYLPKIDSDGKRVRISNIISLGRLLNHPIMKPLSIYRGVMRRTTKKSSRILWRNWKIFRFMWVPLI